MPRAGGARWAGGIRRTVRLGRGLRINLSKGGASLSVGRPGLTENFGRRGARTTVGLPGTGISYSASSGRLGRPMAAGGSALVGLLVLALIIWAIVALL